MRLLAAIDVPTSEKAFAGSGGSKSKPRFALLLIRCLLKGAIQMNAFVSSVAGCLVRWQALPIMICRKMVKLPRTQAHAEMPRLIR